MKQYIYLAAAILLSSGLHAQAVYPPMTNIPASYTTGPSVSSWPDLVNISGVSYRNFTRHWFPDQPVYTFSESGIYHRQSTTYYDGLGRQLQQVEKRKHADGYDIVQHFTYDAFGRQAVSYLPYAYPTESGSNGKLHASAKSNIQAFFAGTADEEPYAITRFDNSPLNLVKKTMSAGRSWVGSDRGITYEYRLNWAMEDVRIWTVGNLITDIPLSSAAYADDKLTVKETRDEDDNWSLEYYNLRGQLVLKKVFDVDNHSTGHNGWACTYYVYDDLDRLRYILPPLAVEQIKMSWDVSTVPDLIYSYFYDKEDRIVEKKIPGKLKEYFVFDKKDRPVLYQDGNMRTAGKWSFTIFDALGRPTMTGLFTSSQTRSAAQTVIDNATTYATTTLWYYLKNYQLYNSYPASLTSCEILTYSYYDGYASLPSSGYGLDLLQFEYSSLPYVVNSSRGDNLRGLLTGSKVKILGSSPAKYLTTVNYYDAKGRMIQSVADNHKEGKDITSMTYFFSGVPYQTIVKHTNPSSAPLPGATSPVTTFKLKNTFGRNISTTGGNDQVWQVTQKINEEADYEFAYYDYDHLGKVTTKMFPAGNVLQEYNIKGWLNHILCYNSNGPFMSQKTFFEERLYYDKGFASKFYNGNIAGIVWSNSRPSGSVDYKLRAYGYDYDKLDRLKHAEYRQKSALPSATVWANTVEDYTTSNLVYDIGGNIQRMRHRGVLPGGSLAYIDYLTYSYATNSNKLIKVEDTATATLTATMPDFKNGSNTATEYTYDDNGNLITDANKGISTVIPYNYLNKPESIVVTGKGTVAYTYDAQGKRLKKTITPVSGAPIVYDYIGNFVYKDNKLEYILNDEGRTRPVVNDAGETKFTYDYFVKDHLGNVRSTVNAQSITTGYLAEHEIATYGAEHLVFDNIANVWDVNPSGSPGNEQAAHLVASDPNTRIGTAIMLRTMPGDEFRISVDAYHEGGYTPSTTVTPATMISSLTSALMGGETYTGVPVSEMPQNMAVISQMMNNPNLATQFGSMLSAETDPSKPQAYLSYLIFDPNLNLIPGKSGTVQVPLGTGSGLPWTEISPATLSGDLVATTDPGYIIIFIHNNSIGKDVWFDNLKIEHYSGNTLDESHYYPFGLTITSTAATPGAANPYKYNGKELTKDFGLETYEYGARQYDPQLGRFKGLDPLSAKYCSISPFVYVANNPVKYVDPDGRKITFAGGENDPGGALVSSYISWMVDGFANRIEIGPNQEIRVNVAGLSPEDIASHAGLQLIYSMSQSNSNYLIEVNSVAKGLNRESGAEVSLGLYDPVTNPGGPPDVNFSTTSRGQSDRDQYVGGGGNDSRWQEFDARPNPGIDGHVIIPLSTAGIVDPANGRPKGTPNILFHSMAEVYERTENSRSMRDAHNGAISKEKALPEGNAAKSASPGQGFKDPDIIRDIQKSERK